MSLIKQKNTQHLFAKDSPFEGNSWGSWIFIRAAAHVVLLKDTVELRVCESHHFGVVFGETNRKQSLGVPAFGDELLFSCKASYGTPGHPARSCVLFSRN